MDKSSGLIRFFEILPGAFSWLTMFFLFTIAIFFPRMLAILMVFYIVFWLLRIFFMSYRLIFGYFLHRQEMKIDWLKLLSALPPKDQWRKIYHLIIVPTYKEDIEILRTSIKSVENSDYPKDRIIYLLATEERDKERAKECAKILTGENKSKFFAFLTTMHPANLIGEVKGKGANMYFAAKKILPLFR